MRDALDQIQSALEKHRETPIGKPFFSDPRYHVQEFSQENFKALEGKRTHLAFVDAGNQELLGGASASLQFVRVYAGVFSGKKRVHQERHEFLCLTQSVDGATFQSTLIPLEGGLLQEEGVFTVNGGEVQDAEQRSKAAQVGALTRRFAEWALCGKILQEFDDVTVVKDGTLQTSVAKESFYARRALSKTTETKTLCALSKTSTLLTTTGWSVTDAVQTMAPSGAWAYEWIGKSEQPDHPAHIAVAKLHPSAERAFRVEAAKPHTQIPWKSLEENASDPAFLGYPYGLVDADHHARVTNAEALSWKALVYAKLGQEADNLAKHTDAHAWLSKL
ncbi:hypothetical protein HY572_00020 [Candidatus Micrarchaeota archaeon]|nr:hypothetical protein [Candidatus Micrarchaeota archaeon]